MQLSRQFHRICKASRASHRTGFKTYFYLVISLIDESYLPSKLYVTENAGTKNYPILILLGFGKIRSSASFLIVLGGSSSSLKSPKIPSRLPNWFLKEREKIRGARSSMMTTGPR